MSLLSDGGSVFGCPWRHPAEGAHLDPLGVDCGHRRLEVTEPLLLTGIQPTFTARLLRRGIGGAIPGHRRSLASGEQSRQSRLTYETPLALFSVALLAESHS